MKTRTGKIARLPRPVREQLNVRLANNEPGPPILAWLNALPEVRAILTAQFDGRDITEQNLSEWRQGGFEDWLSFQTTRDWVRNVVDRSSDLAEDTDKIPVADWLSAPLSVVLGRYIQNIASEEPTIEGQRNILALTRELTRLRNGDHQHAFLRLQRERFEARHAELAAQSATPKPVARDQIQPNPT